MGGSRFSRQSILVTAVLMAGLGSLCAHQVVRLEPVPGDMTPVVRAAIEAVTDDEVRIIFKEGSYHFKPDLAYEKYAAVTNHDNGLKRIIFPLEGFKSVEIEGHGAELIFHGRVMPFQFEECDRVILQNLTIDWDIPFLFEGEVVAVNEAEGWRDIRPTKEGFSWKIVDNQLVFPAIDNFSYSSLGNTLSFDQDLLRVAHGAWDINSRPDRVEKRPDGTLRFHEKLRHYPQVGTMLNSKGPSGENRYAPAVHVKSSRNVYMENVVIHHALGMGFLMERTDTVSLRNCGVYLKEGSNRMVSVTADATHFSNCKGNILVEDCRFENMLDDGTNVHGTYVEVTEIVDAYTLRYELKHFQQTGFEFAGPGDEIWFIHAPSPKRSFDNLVTDVRVVNERFAEVTFREKLPQMLEKGDLLENKTWNPTFTMRGCTIQNHRARNIVLKTPRSVLIEDNDLSSMMSSIFFRGESFYWFESGSVQDVVIQNNRFTHCAYSGAEHAVLNITPRLGDRFSKQEMYDCNINFINNTIVTFDSRIVWADRVKDLLVANNTIIRTRDAEPLYPEAAAFDFKNCQKVCLQDNTIDGKFDKIFSLDGVSQSSLRVTVKAADL